MTEVISYPIKAFRPVLTHGQRVTPFIHLFEVSDHRGAKLVYSGHNAEHLAILRKAGIFQLDPRLNYPGDMILHGHVEPNDWFLITNDTNALFRQAVAKNHQRKVIIGSNAGNAPLHNWEINYAADQAEPSAAKDFEVPNQLYRHRTFFCVTYGRETGINISYVPFSPQKLPWDKRLEVAVGGRPLVFEGRPSPLDEVLTTSITDPRHVLMLPEVGLDYRPDRKIFLPIGLRTVQALIENNRAAEITDKIRAGEFLLIDLEQEKDCSGNLSDNTITEALRIFGYQPEDYKLSEGTLYLKIKLNPYRHTFWAKRGDSLFIGIINNDLPANQGDIHQRVLKPIGLTIPQLQTFLIDQLGVESAVLMGDGKDCRLYFSQTPHRPDAIRRLFDNDVTIDERPAVQAGLLSLAI